MYSPSKGHRLLLSPLKQAVSTLCRTYGRNRLVFTFMTSGTLHLVTVTLRSFQFKCSLLMMSTLRVKEFQMNNYDFMPILSDLASVSHVTLNRRTTVCNMYTEIYMLYSTITRNTLYNNITVHWSLILTDQL